VPVPVASFLTDFWNDQLVANDRQWVFLVLLGLLVSFGFIRLSTRLMRSPRVPWWPGSIVSDGGLHVHHLVFGIVLMMLAGTISFAGFAVSPIYEICAFAFGVGIGLTIDEFALWVYLDDVYWKEEGRASVDAAVLAVTAMALVLLGVRPFDLEGGSVGAVVGSAITVAIALVTATICLLKQRLWHGTVGLLIPPLSLYGALRLGKPGSAWAKRRYGERNPAKQARAEERFRADRRTERLKRAIRDAVGGTPQDEYEAKLQRR
jgi:lysyl-tRNA synthetase class 2